MHFIIVYNVSDQPIAIVPTAARNPIARRIDAMRAMLRHRANGAHRVTIRPPSRKPINSNVRRVLLALRD